MTSTLCREERLRLERKVYELEKRIPHLHVEMRKLDASWQKASGEDGPEAHAIYERDVAAAQKLAEKIEDEERELAEALDLLASDDRHHDERAYLRGVR